jgi:Flp pilus assembly protein TadG
VEFAISIVLFMMLIVGIAWFAIAMYTYHYVSYSAQQAARYAVVRGAHWKSNCTSGSEFACTATNTSVQDYLRGIAPPLINPSLITVTTTWPGTTPSGSTTGCSPANKSGCLVEVTVSYPFSMHVPLAPSTTLQLSANSEMVIQQ